jgi:hypothetical protein
MFRAGLHRTLQIQLTESSESIWTQDSSSVTASNIITASDFRKKTVSVLSY